MFLSEKPCAQYSNGLEGLRTFLSRCPTPPILTGRRALRPVVVSQLNLLYLLDNPCSFHDKDWSGFQGCSDPQTKRIGPITVAYLQ